MTWSGAFIFLVVLVATFNLLALVRRRLGRFRAVVVTRPPALSMAPSRGEALRRDWEACNSLERAREAAADPAARRHLPDPPCEVEG